MSIQTGTTLKTYFNKGDQPTESQFVNLIDSFHPLKPADGSDAALTQFDGTEVARVHDGDVVPSVSGTSTSLSAGTGFGLRRRVLTLGSGNNDNVLALTHADCGSLIYVTPTNNVAITLPVVGTETGLWFDFIIAANHNKSVTIKTGATDGNDNITLFNVATDATTADVGAKIVTGKLQVM